MNKRKKTSQSLSFKQYLNAGEKAAILVRARDRDQAKIVFSYVSGILHAVPALEAMPAGIFSKTVILPPHYFSDTQC